MRSKSRWKTDLPVVTSFPVGQPCLAGESNCPHVIPETILLLPLWCGRFLILLPSLILFQTALTQESLNTKKLLGDTWRFIEIVLIEVILSFITQRH